MFTADPNLTYIAASRGQVVSIIESINHPAVGVPGYPTQAGEGTAVGVRNPGGTFSIFIHLYLVESKASAIYRHAQDEFDLESYPEVEAEAIEFLESMGFMVDNLNFRNLSVLQQDELMARLICFDPNPGARASEIEEKSGGQGSEEIDQLDDDDASVYAAEDYDGIEDLEELEELEPLDRSPRSIDPEVQEVPSRTALRVARLLASF